MPTVKHLSYAGLTLPLPTPEVERGWLARYQNPYDFTDFDGYNFDRPNSAAVPTPPVPRPTEFRLNTLFWPSAASRPAWFHTLVESSRLDAIRTALGVNSALAPLVFYDGRSGKTITASMRMLPERPCNITVGGVDETFWLLTLTDDRYFWYFKRGVITAPASWTNLFSQLGTILGTTITVDTVNADYGTPSSKWAVAYRSPGAILDAAAYSVGQRVVVGLDGSVRTVNWETAKTASDLYFSLADAPISGGRVSQLGIVRCAPSSVNTVFGTDPGGSTHVVNNTLASLSVTGYGAATGIAGYADTIFGDGTYDGANGAALASYAAAAATDLYGWRLSDPDVAWPGIEPWQPTGWEERVEWTMKVREDGPFALTTVRRGPWTEFVAGDYIDDPTSGGTPPPYVLTVREVTGTSVSPVTVIEFDQTDGFVVSDEGGGVARIDFTPTGITLGCGLYFDDDDAIALNLTDVAQDGLYWDQELCVLGIDFDPCTLTLVGNTLTVDLTNLVGDRAETGLIVRENTEPVCDTLSFDDVSFSTTTETLDRIEIEYCGGILAFSKTRTVYTNHFNEQGVITNRVAGTPVTTNVEVDICHAIECCNAETMDVAISGPDTVCEDVEYEWEAIVTGGVGPYTFSWDWGDGSPVSTTNPATHTYATTGTYTITLTVSDSCCVDQDATLEVDVVACVAAPCCEDPLPTVLNLTFTTSDQCCYPQGVTVQLTYDAVNDWWELLGYEGGDCEGFASNFVLYCCASERDIASEQVCSVAGGAVTDWRLAIECDGGGYFTTQAGGGSTCDPLSLLFPVSSPALSGCCSALSVLNITITAP